MISITFKNVGQGDSIFLKWKNNKDNHYGIIDSNIYNNKNPILDELKKRKITNIDFVIISHLHYDHYSGIAEILDYCIDNSVKINKFLHTFASDYLYLFSKILKRTKHKFAFEKFIETFETAISKNVFDIFGTIESGNTENLVLSKNMKLVFHAPVGRDYFDLAKFRAKHMLSYPITYTDIHRVSTIIELSKENRSVLFTSDARKRAFVRLRNKLTKSFELIQVPHHGSSNNLDEKFWQSINKKDKCFAVFSVGDSKKDKLPKKEVVDFFHKQGFYIKATNNVFGISEFYNGNIQINNKSSRILNTFSQKKYSTISSQKSIYFGNQHFNVLK